MWHRHRHLLRLIQAYIGLWAIHTVYIVFCNLNFVYSFLWGSWIFRREVAKLWQNFSSSSGSFSSCSIILSNLSSIASLLLCPQCILLPGVGLLQGVKGGGVVTLLLDADVVDWESSISSSIWLSRLSETCSCPLLSLLSSSPSSATLDTVLKYWNIHAHFWSDPNHT